jgi:sialidase-1
MTLLNDVHAQESRMPTTAPTIIEVARATKDRPRQSEASIVQLKDGSLLLLWMEFLPSQYIGDDEAPAQISAMRSTDGGFTWGGHRVVERMTPGDTNLYCPGIIRLKTGELLFKYDRLHLYRKDQPLNASGFVRKSFDEGKTFTDEVPIWRNRPHAGCPNDIRQLSTGRIIAPIVEMSGMMLAGDENAISPQNYIKAGCWYSDDNGQTWSECEQYVELPLRGAMEPRVEELRNGDLLMVMRTQLGSVFKSISKDGGKTWSKAQTTGLRSPESAGDLLRLPNGDLMIVWNEQDYDPKYDHYGKRNPLTIAISTDDGLTWKNKKYIETAHDREFTNPSSMVTRDGNVLLTYCSSAYEKLEPPGRLGRERMDLKMAIFPVEWLYDE